MPSMLRIVSALILCAPGFMACSANHDTALPASQPVSDGAANASPPDASATRGDGASPVVVSCPIFPSNHIFNTAIDDQPVHANSAAFLATIGSHNIHLDLGTSIDTTAQDYYGIPYNVVSGATLTWAAARYTSTDPSLSWDPTQESDCGSGTSHGVVSPCTSSAAPSPIFPIPASPLVEGGIVTDPSQPYGDHHVLLVDVDACRLWELYHVYPGASGGWDIFGSATFDLRSNALRPDGWTSADAAGFPIFPLLLRASEASSGSIPHALRFTIESSKIRTSYVWPARHLTTNGTASESLPPMGQLFRLKASYAIPSTFGTQSRAILQAMKTYGMYIADGGSDFYVSGEPNESWDGATFSEVQSVSSDDFEAVDLTGIASRPGFDPNSAAVP
jgi:hypothetical protein